MKIRKTDRPYTPPCHSERKRQMLDLLAGGPTTVVQMESILGWPYGTISPLVLQLLKEGHVRRESRKVARTREFVYRLRVDPELFFASVLTRDAYAD
jgi:predicted transcriptional regulator